MTYSSVYMIMYCTIQSVFQRSDRVSITSWWTNGYLPFEQVKQWLLMLVFTDCMDLSHTLTEFNSTITTVILDKVLLWRVYIKYYCLIMFIQIVNAMTCM